MTDAEVSSHASRPSIDDRAARREEIASSDRDRYDSLLRHLQAGREMPLEPRQRWRAPHVDIHRYGPRLLAVAVVVAFIWVGAIVVTDRLRAGRVETWSGPDATVQSGVELAGCTFPVSPTDRSFPVWIRFGGQLYRWGDLTIPIIDEEIPSIYAPTGYTLGNLSLMTVENTPAGKARERVIVRIGGAQGAAVYLVMPDCT